MSNQNKFKHFIFTNFGIGIFDELWILCRLEIFKNTVLLTLENQSNRNFEWVVSPIHYDELGVKILASQIAIRVL